MPCPYCDSKDFLNLVAAGIVFNNLKPIIVATLCCQQPIRVSSKITLVTDKVITDKLVDDFDKPFKCYDSLVGKYVLLRNDINLTTGIIYQVLSEDRVKQVIQVVNCNSLFKRESVLLSGTKEELESALAKYQLIVKTIEDNRGNELFLLMTWLSNHQKS